MSRRSGGMTVAGHGRSDVGKTRATNEDALLVDDELGVFAVCDGLGGHAAGETAARLAIESLRAALDGARDRIAGVARGERDHSSLRDVAVAAVESAARSVWQAATTDPELAGMGCTLTLLVVADQRAAMAHVGDTQLYLRRDGAVSLLSSDHTMVADWVRRGVLTPEGQRGHRLAGVLTRALGTHESVEPVQTSVFMYSDTFTSAWCRSARDRYEILRTPVRSRWYWDARGVWTTLCRGTETPRPCVCSPNRGSGSRRDWTWFSMDAPSRSFTRPQAPRRSR